MDEYDEQRSKFKSMRNAAQNRSIPWTLTWEEFLESWGDKWKDRRRAGLFLTRMGYQGAFEKGNVCVDTRANHVRRQKRLEKHQRETHQRVSTPDDIHDDGRELWALATDAQLALVDGYMRRFNNNEVAVGAITGVSATALRRLVYEIHLRKARS